MGDEIAGEENQVGLERVDVVNDALEEKGLGVFVEMNVADLDDAVVVERGGKIGDGDGAADDVDLVARDLARVKGKSGGGGTCS